MADQDPPRVVNVSAHMQNVRNDLERVHIGVLKHFKKRDNKIYEMLKDMYLCWSVLLAYYSGTLINEGLLQEKVKELSTLLEECEKE